MDGGRNDDESNFWQREFGQPFELSVLILVLILDLPSYDTVKLVRSQWFINVEPPLSVERNKKKEQNDSLINLYYESTNLYHILILTTTASYPRINPVLSY
jgi:hypothetical protein